MGRTVVVAAMQPALRWLQPMANMHALRQSVERLVAEANVDLVVLPEAFAGMPPEYDGGAAGQSARQFLQTLARACRVNVVGGTVEHRDEQGRIFNSCLCVDSTGELIGQYAKRVLFAREPQTRTGGDWPGVFELAGVRVGVLICADLWFPELARELCGQVDLLAVPAKTAVPSDQYVAYARALWHNLALTRAMENGWPVVVSDWAAGRDESQYVVDGTKVREVKYTAGAATIVDPAGRPDMARIQKTLAGGEPGVVVATIDLDAVGEYRTYRRSVGLLPPSGKPE